MVCVGGLTSCNLLENDASVPEAVKQQFSKIYPTIKTAEWDQEGDLFEAEFKISGRERTALFSADGTLNRFSEEIEEQHLPQAILEKLQANYNNLNVSEVLRVQQQNKTYYLVELDRKQEKDILLRFDKNGQLMEQEPVLLEQTSLVSNPVAAAAKPKLVKELGQPEAQWELPDQLREISGIALVQENLMACVQDEDGLIFLYDLEKKKVVNQIAFAGPGDYEGIVLVGDTAYVLRSDGTLYEVPAFQTGKAKAVTYPSQLQANLDTEGLAYDKANKRLLIGYKAEDSSLKEAKGIYAFSLSTKKFEPTPVLSILLKQAGLESNKPKQGALSDLLQASSLEMNPATGTLVLLDSPNKQLLSISEDGKVQQVYKLDKQVLRQPEGLAFGQQGEMFIASEGSKKVSGLLVKYPAKLP